MDRGQKKTESVPVSGRDLRLDALRGIAVLLMTEQHIGIWLVDFRKYWGSLGPLVFLNMLGGMAAPLFVLLAGVSAFYSPGSGEARQSMVRGLRLIAVGLVLNLLTPGWFSWSSFYVLHLLGSWLILAPAIGKLSRVSVLVSALATFALGVIGQTLLATPRELSNLAMSGRTGKSFFRLAFFEGHFPLFPWLALALIGYFAAKPYREGRTARLFGLSAISVSLAGLAYCPTWLLGRAARKLPWRALAGLEFYPATPALLLGLTSIGLVLLALLTKLDEKRWLRPNHPLVLFGRTSLTLLVVHVVLFRELFQRMGLGGRFSPAETLGTIFATWLVWWLFARAWALSGFRFGLEWLLRYRR